MIWHWQVYLHLAKLNMVDIRRIGLQKVGAVAALQQENRQNISSELVVQGIH